MKLPVIGHGRNFSAPVATVGDPGAEEGALQQQRPGQQTDDQTDPHQHLIGRGVTVT